MSEEKPSIKVTPVNTWNEQGDRFILTFDEEESVYYYDNHKRDGYGLVAGKNSRFMGTDSRISKTNFEELFNKLNELYRENQALKNGNEYHKILKEKFRKEEHELLESYESAYQLGSKDTARFYMDLINILGEIEQHTFQGEEYE